MFIAIARTAYLLCAGYVIGHDGTLIVGANLMIKKNKKARDEIVMLESCIEKDAYQNRDDYQADVDRFQTLCEEVTQRSKSIHAIFDATVIHRVAKKVGINI